MKRKKGFTLVELIVGLLLASMMLVAAAAILAPATKTYADIYNMSNQQVVANMLIDDISSHFGDVTDIYVCNSSTNSRVSDGQEGDTLIYNNNDFENKIANVYYIMDGRRKDDSSGVGFLSIRYLQPDEINRFGLTGITINGDKYVGEEAAQKEFALSTKTYVGANKVKIRYTYFSAKKLIKIQVEVGNKHTDYYAKRISYVDVE